MKNLNTKQKNILYYFSAIFIVTALYMLVCFVADIFPFGNGSVVYDDMVQHSMPMYTYVWDVVHGKATALFSWNTAGGVFIPDALSELINPISIVFFLICKRAALFNSMTFFVLIKFICIALSMSYFMNKTFKIPRIWKLALTLIYTFSAYNILYYTNTNWMDIVALFPLIVLALLYLFKTNKIAPFTLLLSYALMRNIYLGFMIYLFLIFVGGLYILLILPRETKKTTVFKFGTASVLSLFMSAVVVLPSYSYISESARFSNANSFITLLTAGPKISFVEIVLGIMLMALPVALVIFFILNYKKEKRMAIFSIISLLALSIPIFFENINLIWHMGSYNLFPYRFAFMLSFLLAALSAYTLEKFKKKLFKSKWIFMAPAAVFAAAGLYLMFKYNSTPEGIFYYLRYAFAPDNKKWLLIFIILIPFYFLITVFGKKRISGILAVLMILTESFVFMSYSFSDGYTQINEYNIDYFSEVSEIEKNLKLENDNLSRLKSKDAVLNSNYPESIGYPSYSNFTHILPVGINNALFQLGYSSIYTRISDTGGTALTDALLNYKHVFGHKDADKGLYEHISQFGNFELYSIKNTLPFGSVVTDNLLDEQTYLSGSRFESNNKLFKAIFKTDRELFTEYTDEIGGVWESDKKTIHADGKRTLYFYYEESSFYAAYIKVNGVEIAVGDMTTSNTFNTYKLVFNNGILELGTFEDEDVTVEIIDVNGTPIKYHLGIMDTELFETECREHPAYADEVKTEKRSLSMNVKAENDGQYLFLPLTNDRNWSCSVNGKEQKIEAALTGFMSVKLAEGENAIEMKYTPYGFHLGIAVSLISLLLLAFIVMLEKRNTIKPESQNVFFKTLYLGFETAVIAAYICIYIIPMIITVILTLIE